MSNWQLDNLSLIIIVSAIGAVIFIGAIGTVLIKLLTQQSASRNEWLIAGLVIFFALVIFVLTGLDSSPITI